MTSFASAVDFKLPHIRIRQLNKYYQVQDTAVHALKNIHLDIPVGSIFGIIGKSGAGKSSLLRTLNGLEHISEGSIYIDQHELSGLSHPELIALRQRIGMIFQHFNLMSAKTVWENIALPLKIAHHPAEEIQQRVSEALSLVGLSDKADHYPSQLSGGQKQRVGIARALIQRPEILLCDEATSALDPESTALILSLLKKINQKFAITIVLITHEMQVIREICDQVVVIDQGEIVESGPVWSVFSQPQQKITQELLHLDKCELGIALSPTAQPNSLMLLKLSYAASLDQPLDLQQLSQVFGANLTLYQSHLDVIQNHFIGQLILAVTPIQGDLTHIQQQLKANFTQIEVLGYVQHTA